MARGQNYTKEKWSELGREGGKTSAIVRRDRILQKYIKIARNEGIEIVLRLCRAEAWKNGYASCYHTQRRPNAKPRIF